MRFGKRQNSGAAGADYLLGVSSEQGIPFAADFAQLVIGATSGDGVMGPTFLEIIAASPLTDYEAAPISIITAAVNAAQARGDQRGASEAAQLGLLLLAKWPRYLASTTSGHPDLTRRS